MILFILLIKPADAEIELRLFVIKPLHVRKLQLAQWLVLQTKARTEALNILKCDTGLIAELLIRTYVFLLSLFALCLRNI